MALKGTPRKTPRLMNTPDDLLPQTTSTDNVILGLAWDRRWDGPWVLKR